MKLDLQSLSAEPLVYMLIHSGVFVTVLGLIFFFIGVLFGRATWGRYKRQTRELHAEVETLKEETANLKRRLGELSVKPGPNAPMMTETIPMPRKEAAPAPKPAPVAAEPAKEKDASAADGLSEQERLQRSRGNVIKTRAPAVAEEGADGGAAPAAEEVAHVAPLIDVAASATRQSSALAGIISQKDVDSAAGRVIPTLPEIPGNEPEPDGEPRSAEPARTEIDPHLGLVYKSRPAHADDLTALKGIARVLEQRLHGLGVYTYAQIADWTKDHVREFSSRLAFKDRIQREQWVEQAQALVAKRQAEPVQAAAAA